MRRQGDFTGVSFIGGFEFGAQASAPTFAAAIIAFEIT
jgi:hypothetical protein